METRTYTAKFNVGQRISIDRPDYKVFHETPDPFEGLTGTITRVIFPGDILYEDWGIPNGTGAVNYDVELDKPHCGTTKYIFAENELVSSLAR